MADPYVIVEGGVVQNTPSIPVLDFDILSEHSEPDDYTIQQVRDLWALAKDYDLPKQYQEDCLRWLEEHDAS